MGMADVAEVLWRRCYGIILQDPEWPNRDRLCYQMATVMLIIPAAFDKLRRRRLMT